VGKRPARLGAIAGIGICGIVALCCFSSVDAGSVITNGAFSTVTPTTNANTNGIPAGWSVTDWGHSGILGGEPYALMMDSVDFHTAAPSAKVIALQQTTENWNDFHLFQNISPAPSGHTVHVRAWVKGQNFGNSAHPLQFVLLAGKNTGAPNFQWQQIAWFVIGDPHGLTNTWTLKEADYLVPTDCTELSIRYYVERNQLVGATFWADDVEVTDLNTGTIIPSPKDRSRGMARTGDGRASLSSAQDYRVTSMTLNGRQAFSQAGHGSVVETLAPGLAHGAYLSVVQAGGTSGPMMVVNK
jgi:hypothetical protein